MYYQKICEYLSSVNENRKAYGSKPRVMPDERRRRSGERTPPKASHAIFLDALAQQGSPASPLDLESGLDGVDRGQDNAEARGT